MTFNLTEAEVNGVLLGIGILLTFGVVGLLGNMSNYFKAMARVEAAKAYVLEQDVMPVDERQEDINSKDDTINDLLDMIAENNAEHYEFCKSLLEKLTSVLTYMTPPVEPAVDEPAATVEEAPAAEVAGDPNATKLVPTSEGTSGLDSQSA